MKTPIRVPASPKFRFQPILTRLIDSVAGYRLAADLSDHSRFIRFSRQCANAREIHAEELAAAMGEAGFEPSMHGSRSAAVHRAWIALNCRVFPGTSRHLPAECLRGEVELRRLLQRTTQSSARTVRMGRLLEELRDDLAIQLEHLRALGAGPELKPATPPFGRYAA